MTIRMRIMGIMIMMIMTVLDLRSHFHKHRIQFAKRSQVPGLQDEDEMLQLPVNVSSEERRKGRKHLSMCKNQNQENYHRMISHIGRV